MKTQAILLKGPCGALEASLTIPDSYHGLGVVCHPHPLYQGSMNNKVVTTTAKTFAAAGLITARFNFRGVGNSAGTYAEGLGEQADALTVIHWLQQQYGSLPLWLAGFSFGSYVAAHVAPKVSPCALILIAPPVERFSFETLTRFPCFTHIFMGTDDEVVTFAAVSAWQSRITSDVEYKVFPKTSHFFHGRLADLRTAIESVCQARC